MYKVFGSRRDRLADALGLRRLLPAGRDRYQEFWALRGIGFELARGGRLGIIGRNGAGKSTLLKLVTQNFPPTEGRVEVRGSVQALLEVGSGLHPEFTGRENIQASLGFLGLSRAEIEEAARDIADFTELGRFLDQPFKTYSLGMQARLGIGIATTIRPEILIIDEVLGTGDAYFFGKSTARMQRLLSEGASVLLVSHALDQIARFCDETIWLDRGRIVMRGPTTEVIKAYEKFIRELDERRLRAKNRGLRGPAFDGFERESSTHSLEVVLRPAGQDGQVDVQAVVLHRDESEEDRARVGDAQDADLSQSAFVVLEGSRWSEPAGDESGYFRSIADATGGRVDFNLWFFYPDSRYSLSVRYRSETPVRVAVTKGEEVLASAQLPAAPAWADGSVPLGVLAAEDAADTVAVSRWAGEGALTIESVSVRSAGGDEQMVFQSGEPLSVAVGIRAHVDAGLPLTPAALVFRTDGLVMTRHVGHEVALTVRRGDTIEARLDLGPLLLGNGSYLISVGLYRKLDPEDQEPSEFYDYFDRSFEFRVVGNPPLHNELVRHPGTWTFSEPVRGASRQSAQVG